MGIRSEDYEYLTLKDTGHEYENLILWVILSIGSFEVGEGEKGEQRGIQRHFKESKSKRAIWAFLGNK